MTVVEFRWIRNCLVLIVLGTGATTALAGEMYRWTDANGKVQFSDRPPPEGAKPIELDKSRMSVVDTVVVKDNAMRSVVQREVQRQQSNRTAAVNSAESAAQRAESAKASRCATLAARVRRAENSTGSLLNGRMTRADDQYWEECHR